MFKPTSKRLQKIMPVWLLVMVHGDHSPFLEQCSIPNKSQLLKEIAKIIKDDENYEMEAD